MGARPVARRRALLPRLHRRGQLRQRLLGSTELRHHRRDHRRAVVRSDPPARARLRSDRKSTRLNSSHGYISYAVFCLKKKKKKNKKNIQQKERNKT